MLVIRSVVAGLSLIAVSAVSAGAIEPPELYIHEAEVGSRFKAVSLDGGSVRELFSSPGMLMHNVTGMDFDPVARRLWWMDTFPPNKIVSANLDGSGQEICYSSSSHLYFCARDAMGRLYFTPTPGNWVARVNADGSGFQGVSSSSGYVTGIGIDSDNGHVYVGTTGPIYRANLDGTNQKTVVRGSGAASGIALDIEHRRIYWIDSAPHTRVLMSANLDGTDLRHLALSGVDGGLRDLVIDRESDQLFFNKGKQIYSCGLNGENLRVIYEAPYYYNVNYMTLSTGKARQPLNDCDGNGVSDDTDIANGAPDCDRNGVPDECQSEPPCEEKDLVLDTDWNMTSEGHVVGTVDGWEYFQAIYVPYGGWSVSEIGIDGYTTRYAQGLGLSVSFHPNTPGTLLPDDSITLSSGGPIHLQLSTTVETWQYTPVEIRLSQGVYWLRIRSNEPEGAAKLRYGYGPPGRRRMAGSSFEVSRAISLRLVRSERCLLDYDKIGEQGDILDLLAFLDDFFACDQSATPCGEVDNPDYTGDGVVDIMDLLSYIDHYSRGC